MKVTLLVIVALLLAGLAAVRGGLLRGQPPLHLGVRDGRLAPPSTTPNSVHSQSRLFTGHPQAEDAHIEPLALGADGPAAIARLKAVLEAWPRARVVDSRADYVRVEFETRWMRFVDDAEFWFDPAAGAVQLRSASRLGKGDLGINRARIEALRGRLQRAG